MNNDALKEYQRKIAAGEIERSASKNPAEKALANPKSMRAAINAKCYDCTGQQINEIRLCEMTDCPLYKFRPYQPK